MDKKHIFPIQVRKIKTIGCALIFLILFVLSSVSATEAACQHTIVFLGLLEQNDMFQLWAVCDDGTDLQQLTEIEGGIIDLYKLQGKKVAYYASDSFLYVLDLNTGMSEPLTMYENSNASIALSPDTSYIVADVFHDLGHSLMLSHVKDTQESRILVQQQRFPFSPMTWNLVNPSIVYFHEKNTLKKINVTTSQIEDVYSASSELYSYSLSSNEKTMALCFESTTPNISIIDVYRDQQHIDSIQNQEGYSVVEPDLSHDGQSLVYVDDFGISTNRLMLYSLESLQKKTLVEGQGAIAKPLIY